MSTAAESSESGRVPLEASPLSSPACTLASSEPAIAAAAPPEAGEKAGEAAAKPAEPAATEAAAHSPSGGHRSRSAADVDDDDVPDMDAAAVFSAATDFIVQVHKGLPQELEDEARRSVVAAEHLVEKLVEEVVNLLPPSCGGRSPRKSTPSAP